MVLIGIEILGAMFGPVRKSELLSVMQTDVTVLMIWRKVADIVITNNTTNDRRDRLIEFVADMVKD